MKIVLLRHGRPAVKNLGKMSGAGFQNWIDAYNSADLDLSCVPSAESVNAATECRAVVCSDLPRSIASAQSLGFTQLDLVERDFREMELPCANIPWLNCPASFWAVVFRVAWFLGYSTGVESYQQAKIRARHCAQRLIKIAQQNDSVVFVGHGFLNRFIAKELTHLGWQGQAKAARAYWGFAVYERAE